MAVLSDIAVYCKNDINYIIEHSDFEVDYKLVIDTICFVYNIQQMSFKKHTWGTKRVITRTK